jgi:hypothetical protein
MWRTRFRIVFILLVLILLLASALFGVLTYWLGGRLPPVPGSRRGGEVLMWGMSRPEMDNRVGVFGRKTQLP